MDSFQAMAPDAESRRWLRDLEEGAPERADAVAALHGLLLRAARFEVARRHAIQPHLRGGDLDDLAMQAADDALVAVLSKLDDFRGESRFTTWAYKFGLFEAAAKVRKRAWQRRELPMADDTWAALSTGSGAPAEEAERSELLGAIATAVDTALSDRQRDVFVSLALNGVPIDVLAERLGSTRGAIYKMLHDARRKLRDELAAQGFDDFREEGR
ncbi:MAG TPA: sigma-70 family RNA polymerase sigma factor [Thermoleophilaceae bacterium]|nr:sigma-70 family RNA polymerase sigma factor [Thermoleophilaceae bacterium]